MPRRRNYHQEYLNEKPERRKKRAQRNKARRWMKKEGKVKVGDGKVVDHKKPMSSGGRTTKGNLRIMSQKASNKQGGRIKNKKKG